MEISFEHIPVLFNIYIYIGLCYTGSSLFYVHTLTDTHTHTHTHTHTRRRRAPTGLDKSHGDGANRGVSSYDTPPTKRTPFRYLVNTPLSIFDNTKTNPRSASHLPALRCADTVGHYLQQIWVPRENLNIRPKSSLGITRESLSLVVRNARKLNIYIKTSRQTNKYSGSLPSNWVCKMPKSTLENSSVSFHP